MKLKKDSLIKKWEELRLVAYMPTPNDRWTIGWGHTEGVYQGMKISKEQAQKLFEEDVAWAEDAVNKLVKVPLNQNQFDALVSFVFNIGEPNFRGSTMLRKLNKGDYDGAADEFPKWKYQKRKVLRGLVRRRAEEMEVFLDPVDQNNTTGVVNKTNTPQKASKSPDIWASVLTALSGVGSVMGGEYLGSLSWPVLAATAVLVGVSVYLVWSFINKRRENET